jgi:hypothetical protein
MTKRLWCSASEVTSYQPNTRWSFRAVKCPRLNSSSAQPLEETRSNTCEGALVALSKRWHEAQEPGDQVREAECSGLSGTCHVARMYTHLCATVTAPRKFDRGTAQALLRDARALRPTLRSHFTVRAEPYVTMSMAGVTSSLDVQDRYAVVFEPWRCPIAVEVRSRKELHKRIPKYTTTGVGYLATYLVLGSRIMLTLAS